MPRALIAFAGVAAAWFLPPKSAAAEAGFEIVPLETVTFHAPFSQLLPPVTDGRVAEITGLFRLPEGSGPFPAVVIAPACSGVGGSAHRWAEELRREGIASMIVNSLTGRSSWMTCNGGGIRSPASFVADVYAARARLARHPHIDPSRIALLGFSEGGRTALWARSARFRERFGGTFAAYLAFYPPCMARLADEGLADASVVRIFHGSRDDLAAPEPCRDYVRRLKAAGVNTAMVEYPEAGHAFDSGDLKDRTIASVMNYSQCRFVEADGVLRQGDGRAADLDSPCVTRGGSIAYSRAAHERASQDLRHVLEEIFRKRE